VTSRLVAGEPTIKLFEKMTQEIIDTPNFVRISHGGIYSKMAIKLRGVLEVMDNAIPPKYQVMILEQWLDLIKHKVIGAVWCNHAVMREENVLGWSPTAKYNERKGHLPQPT